MSWVTSTWIRSASPSESPSYTKEVPGAWGHYFYGFSPLTKSYEMYADNAVMHRPDPRMETVEQIRTTFEKGKTRDMRIRLICFQNVDYIDFRVFVVVDATGGRHPRNGVHVWLITHPAKMYSDNGKSIPAPGLYDISGSAHFANKADVGITVHRPDPKTPDAEIHVRKVRFKHVGKIGCLRMRWEKSTGRYEAIDSS